MSLTRFQNFETISTNNTKTLGRTIPDSIIKSLSYNEGIIDNFKVEDSSIDIHVYNNSNDYIKSLYNQMVLFDPEYNDFYYNISKLFFNSGLNSGTFKLCLNFSLDLFGNISIKPLQLKEVSPDLTELKFEIPSKTITENPSIVDQFKEFDSVVSNLKSFGRVNNLVVNFGSNVVQPIVNIKVECNEDYFLYVKLLNGLDGEVDINDFSYVSFKLCEDYVDSFLVSPLDIELKPNSLRGPNFDIPFELEGGESTAFQSWNTLLDSTETTTNDILQSVISSSKSIPINVDYTDFNNFVYYGSATERIKNYDYKRRLIDYYESNLVSSSVSSSFYGSVNNIKFKNKIENLKYTFDPFESWLHEESGSLFTHDISGSVTPAPKYISSSRYYLYATSESMYQNWYNSSLTIAEDYDRVNLNRLYEYTPGHIVNDSNNSEYILFLDMIGHHFDNLYTYVRELTSIHSKDEHPKRGIPSKLLREYAESLGWHVNNGYQISDLWLYKLGTNNSGSFSDLDTLPSVAHEQLSTQIWKRVVNNLPILLKTKGTARSVKALMSSYGIPKTLISIKEYGGPTAEGFDSYREEDVFNYALKFSGDQYVRMNSEPIFGSASSTYEFRFKTDYSASLSMSLWAIESTLNRDNVFHNLELISYLAESTSSYSGSYKYGKLRYTGTYELSGSEVTSSAESDYLPFFDNDFWDVQIRSDQPLTDSNDYSTFTISTAKSSNYTSNRLSFSSSFNWTPPSGTVVNKYFGAGFQVVGDNNILIGGTTGSSGASNSPSRFSGSIQFFREYSEPLTFNDLVSHSLNPSSYAFSDYTSSYNDMIRYFPLGGDVIRYNHTSSTVISSSHPSQMNYDKPFDRYTNADFKNFTGTQSDQYSVNNEVYYVKIPSTGANIEKSNKVRIEENSTSGFTLSPDKRVERSSYDRSSKDGNRLVIAYSPTDQINRDIYNQFGYFRLDNIIGDPRDQEKDLYTGFDRFRNEYWKKYELKNNFNRYIEVFSLFNFTFFEQIKQLVPARSNLISGVLIENTVLERPRIERKNPSISQVIYEDTLNVRSDRQVGKYTLYTASLEYDKEVFTEDFYETSSIDLGKDLLVEEHYYTSSANITKEVFTNDVTYTGSMDHSIGFESLEKTSPNSRSNNYIRTTEEYIGSRSLYDNYNLSQSKYVGQLESSGSVGLLINPIQDITGSYKVFKSGSSLRRYNTVSGSRIGVEYVERERSYSVKSNGVKTEYTRSFNETDSYVINLTTYQDNPFDHFDEEDRIGIIKNFNYQEYYYGSFSGSYEVTSSLMGIQTVMTSSLLYEFIDKYRYIINSNGNFYRVKDNGSVQVYVTGSRSNKDYKTRVYFYSASKGFNDNYIYNNVDVAVSMSKGDFYSSSLKDATYQYTDDSVYNRVRFGGSRLEGPGININTSNTIDGGPVVTVTQVDSTDLVV